jgi:hypothetical protein
MRPLADDLLNGASEIAKFMGWTRSKTFHALEARALPGFKMPGSSIWHARRSTLTAHVATLERAKEAVTAT